MRLIDADARRKTMKKRSFDEMIAYFNRRVAEMDIAQDYKMELLGMVTALGYKHEKTAQPEQPERPSGRTVYQAGYAEGYKAGQQERKTGKWVRHYSRPNVYADLCWHCSNCGYKTPDNWANKWKFCPNCGARMVQEGEEP